MTNYEPKYLRLLGIALALLLILVTILTSSCYNQRKAKSQFSRAAIAYPKLPADYCATTFPVKDSTIRDTLITTDTVLVTGQDITDTVRSFDTIRITTVRYLPGKVITNTFHITDTIYQENTAALKACQIDNSTMTDLLAKRTNEVEKYKGRAQKRGYIMWGLLLLIALVVGWKVYSSLKPKIKTI